MRYIDELSIYQLSILIDRFEAKPLPLPSKRLRLFAVHARWNAAGIIVANRREQIFLVAVPSRDYGSSRVRSCRKNALGRSAVLAENSTSTDGVAGRLNRTISSRTNCLDGRSVAAGASCAKWLFANEVPGTERGPRVRDEARREERTAIRSLARSSVQTTILSATNGAPALEVS